MLKFFAALLMIAIGMAQTGICEIPDQCRQNDMPDTFPETEEELQKVCIYGKLVMECLFEYAETYGDEDVQMGYKIIETIEEVCDEDTLLHAAIVDNLKCFKESSEDDRKCRQYAHEISPDRVHGQATSLIEEGILSLEHYENNTYRVTECIATMNYFACNSVELEKQCGVVAMDAFVDIVRKAGPGLDARCNETYGFLPTFIRLHKLEEEKEQSIAEAFKRENETQI